jgi:hypothetical protein
MRLRTTDILAKSLLVGSFAALGLMIYSLPATQADGQVEPPSGAEPEKRRVGIVIPDVTNTPKTVIGPAPVKIVLYCMAIGGAADETVTLRPIGGGQGMTFAVPAGATVGKNLNAKVPAAGFEVLTASPAGDVEVSCNYITGPGP